MTVYHSRRPSFRASDAACSGVDCTVTTALDTALLLLWTGIGMFLIGVFYYQSQAESRCYKESTRVSVEVRAFEQFAKRVQNVPVHSAQTVSAQPPLRSVAASFAPSSDVDELHDVRAAYRETVMSVSHYDEDYGESLAESVREELGSQIAAVMMDGDRLTPEMKHGIVTHAVEARNRRERFVEILAKEEESLTESYRQLKVNALRLNRLNDRPVADYSYDDLVETWPQLNDLQERIEVILTDRQEGIQSINSDPRLMNTQTVYAYLYHQLPTIDPVLADGMRLFESVMGTKHTVVDALTHRV